MASLHFSGSVILVASNMKILILGGGGREHAIAWRLAQSPLKPKLYAMPGNPGIAQLGECVSSADEVGPDLVVVGPEVPLVEGIVDRLAGRGIPCVGQKASAARLEGSKVFSKTFMQRYSIPTARFKTAHTPDEARQAFKSFGFPVVLKADGLAAGKGVVIASNEMEAETAVATLNGSLVIEEFLAGEEVSFIVLTDGKNVVPLEPTQDHKTVFEDDRGPNTGGMGAYSDSRILTTQQTSEILDTVIEPALAGMRKEGYPFTGFLYAGLMMTAEGPRVLEFNVRLGDPETQALMHRLTSDWAAVLAAAGRGDLKGVRLEWSPDPSVCVVLAAHGYPAKTRSGDRIEGVDAAQSTGATVFHAGTKSTAEGLVTSGGRVLGVTASGADLSEAIDNTYGAVDKIHFDGMHYRRDIGRKGLKRYNETSSGT
jgi:phosphoribosylamine--glycine ligase